MPARTLTFTLLPGHYAVCRLEAGAAIPSWATEGSLFSVTRTADELSIVCPEEAVPAGVRSAGEWRALKIEGPFDFSEVGILAAVTGALADAGISLFAVSTFDTDYVLVQEATLDRALTALLDRGHSVDR